MKTNRTMKCRMLGALLACLLVLGVTSPVQAATAKATTMKLESTSGTVSLTTQNGTARKITKGMRLYNGYTLETAASSYAYISLDSSKAVKLDASSKASLRQSGKKLELLVKSGKLFFNVKTPLTGRESMNVRTSTMVTGVRGTCGVVEAVSASESKLYLIEGKVTCQTVNKETGKKDNIEVVGGQTATFSTSAHTDEKVVVEKMAETDIPLFAIQEVVKDTQLQDKIERQTDLDVSKMTEYLQQQQNGGTQNGEQNGGSNQGDSTQNGDSQNENTNPGGNQPANPSSPSSPGSSTPSVTPSYPNNPSNPSSPSNPGGTPGTPSTPSTPVTPSDPTPPVTPPEQPDKPQEPVVAELNGEITAAQVQDAWSRADIVKIVQGAKLNVTAADNMAVQNKKQLRIASGASMVIAQDAKLTIQSEKGVQVYGTVENKGTIAVQAAEGREGHLLIAAPGAQIAGGKLQVVKGEVSNEGIICLHSLTTDSASGKIYNNGIIKVEQRNAQDLVSLCDSSYTSGWNGVLYSSVELLNEARQPVQCNDTIQLASESSGYYYYVRKSDTQTGYLSENMAQLMNEAAADTEVTYKFMANALIPQQQSAAFKRFKADLAQYELIVEGELIFSRVEIKGRGEAVIRMQGGTLKMEGSEPDCGIANERENTPGYVIEIKNRGSGGIVWTNKNLMLKSVNLAHTIQGLQRGGTTNDVNCSGLEGYLKMDAGAKIGCIDVDGSPATIYLVVDAK